MMSGGEYYVQGFFQGKGWHGMAINMRSICFRSLKVCNHQIGGSIIKQVGISQTKKVGLLDHQTLGSDLFRANDVNIINHEFLGYPAW